MRQAPVRSRFPILHDRPSLETADHTLKLERGEYKKLLKEEQDKLFALEPQLYINRIPMIIMYEGWVRLVKGVTLSEWLRRLMLVRIVFSFTCTYQIRIGASSSMAVLDSLAKSWSCGYLRS